MGSLAVEVQQPRAKSIIVTEENMSVDLTDGRTIVVPLAWFPRLWHGTSRERIQFEIVGDGCHIHCSELDEDLTVAGLLKRRRSGESPQSLKKWLDSRAPGRKKSGSLRGGPVR